MIVSHRKQFIFIANGKTGTTSVEAVLDSFQEEARLAVPVDGLYLGKHTPAPVLRELLGGEIWSRYFKFGFVRNPVDRFLSIWRHYLRESRADPRRLMRHPRSGLQHLRRARALRVPRMPERIEAAHVRHIVELQSSLRIRYDLETNLQYPMFFAANGECCVDFIGRYENLKEDWRTVSERIAVGSVALPLLNAGEGHRATAKFSEEACSLLKSVYKEDFARFGYDLPPEYCE